MEGVSSFMNPEQSKENIEVVPAAGESIYKIGGNELIELVRGKNCGQRMQFRLANAVLDHIAEQIETEGVCTQHRNQPLVAFDTADQAFGCEQCVYDGNFEQPNFVSMTARDVSDNYIEQFDRFKEIQKQVQLIQPSTVTSNIRITVNKFFMALKSQLDQVEMDVMNGIKQSKNLQNFLGIVEDLADEFDDELADAVEEEKSLIDDKIDQNKFAYLTLKNQSYAKITEKFSQVNERADQAINQVLNLQDNIIKQNMNTGLVQQKFRELIEQLIYIDGENIDFGKTGKKNNVNQANVNKPQVGQEENKFNYVIQENKILEVDVLEKAQKQIKELENVYLPKVLALQNASLLVIGGQSEFRYGEETTEILKTVSALKKDYVTEQWYLSPKDRMANQRVSFGCCLVGSKMNHVMVQGGFTDKLMPIGKCEVYNVEQNKWSSMPDLNSRRSSCSSISLANGFVYVFGGEQGKADPINSIERLQVNLNNIEGTDTDWEIIDLQLKYGLVNIGCLQVSNNEILVFGGYPFYDSQEGLSATTDGQIMLVTNSEEGEHTWLNDKIDLVQKDVFLNSSCSSIKHGSSFYIPGQKWIHKLDLHPAKRFSVQHQLK